MSPEERSAAAEAIAARGLPFELAAGAVVSGYSPIRNEIDPAPLMQSLASRGARLALPVVLGRGRPLALRAWAFGEPLAKEYLTVKRSEVRGFEGKDVAFVKSFLEQKLEAGKASGLTRQKLYAAFRAPGTKTAPIIARLEAEKASKDSGVDGDAALNEMMA